MQLAPWRKGQVNRNAIINAVKTLGECYPREITDFIDNTIRQKCRLFGLHKETEIESRVQRERVKERTLFDWLKTLTGEGILSRTNSKYSLTDKAKSDDRYFPDLVGDSIISQLMLLHRPTLNPFEHNIKQLVESFGFYLLWCFVYGARPIDNESLSGKNKDAIIANWLIKSINPLNSYEYFLAAIKNQEHDQSKIESEKKRCLNLTSELQRGLISKKEVSIPSTDYFYVRELDAISNDKFNHPTKSRYELSDKILDRLIDILQLVYPEYYQMMRSNPIPISFNPKQQFMKETN